MPRIPVLLLAVLFGVGLTGRAGRAEPRDDASIVADLGSDDPRRVAWAAWQAAERRLTAVRPYVVPLLQRLATRRTGEGAGDPLVARLLEDEARWAPWILEEHVLDLAIRLDVYPPAHVLEVFAGGGRAAVVASLLAHPDPPAASLLGVFDLCRDDYEPEGWIALGNLMVRRRTPGFAARVLAGYAVRRTVRVWDDDDQHPDLLEPRSSICYDGFFEVPAGYPPTVLYRLAIDDRRPDGEHPVRWYRRVSREDTIGFGGVTGTWPDPARVREVWLQRMAAAQRVLPPACDGHLDVRYVGRQPWERALSAWIQDLHDRHWRLVAALLEGGRLRPAEIQHAHPRFEVEVEDHRCGRRRPLPPLPPVAPPRPTVPCWLERRSRAGAEPSASGDHAARLERRATMHYTVEIDIDLPRDQVIELFDSTENLKKWQRGLQVFEPLEGEPGQPGAKSRMVFQMGKRKIEMVETITARDLPDSSAGTYVAKGVHNAVKNRFLEIAPDKTRWVSENEFVFSGFMKVVGFLAKSAFPRQSMKYMQDFKAFAEEGRDVNA